MYVRTWREESGRLTQTQERPRTTNGAVGGSRPAEPLSTLNPLRLARTLTLPVLVLAFAIVGALGYFYWLEQTYYVTTDNALITGTIAQVASPTAGTLRAIFVDVGDPVARNQIVAIVGGGGTGSVGQVQLRAPVDGVVLTINADRGDVATVGRSVMTIVDPDSLFVRANIDETKVARVRPGQIVDVTIDALGTTLPGRVTVVGQASAATIFQAPATSSSGYFVKIPQLVPVRIDLAYAAEPIFAGGSAVVRIRVQD